MVKGHRATEGQRQKEKSKSFAPIQPGGDVATQTSKGCSTYSGRHAIEGGGVPDIQMVLLHISPEEPSQGPTLTSENLSCACSVAHITLKPPPPNKLCLWLKLGAMLVCRKRIRKFDAAKDTTTKLIHARRLQVICL